MVRGLLRRRGSIMGTVGLLGLVLVYPWLVHDNPYWMNLAIQVLLFAALGQAWNWVGGYAGQVSFGHAAFFGMGAYTSSVLWVRAGINPWLGMLVGMALAGIVAALIGLPIFRLQGHYFAIATIALAEILRIAADSWEAIGGAAGIELPIRPSSWLNFEFASKTPYYGIALAMTGMSLLVTWWLTHSRAGYYLRAIREDQDAARALGVHVQRYKTLALVLSAMQTAMLGTFYAQYILFIDPKSTLGLDRSILISLVPMLGGAGTFLGPVLGSAVLIPFAELTRSYLGGTGRAYNLIFYGILIMLVAVLEPGGLWALKERLRGRQAVQEESPHADP